jgi:hypothetical protein
MQSQPQNKTNDLRPSEATLLGLPIELRQEILQYGLTSEEPIRQSCKWLVDVNDIKRDISDGVRMKQAHPQILSTCRQLYSDGIDYLYSENTVKILYLMQLPNFMYESGVHVVGECSLAAALVKYPKLSKIKSWQIVFKIEGDEYTISRPSFAMEAYGSWLQRFAEIVRSDMALLSQMRGLTIDVRSRDYPFRTLVPYRADVCSWLCLLRCEKVSITSNMYGADFKRNLMDEITSDKPINSASEAHG